MNSNINVGMKGAYKVDIKNPQGKIVESTDWFDNDITNVGLNYPFFYSFAHCFMFLSLGSNTVSASGPRQNFSGFPINILTGILVFDPNYTGAPPAGQTQTGFYYQPTQYIGWQGYELGQPKNSITSIDSSTCGTTYTNQGVNFYRGWTIPTGLSENFGSQLAQNVTINSLMVSPSSGGDLTGQYAFSLVDRSIVIPSGFSATITYQLSLSFPTYTNTYNLFQSYTGTGGFNYTGFTGNYTGNPNGWFSLNNAATGTLGSETGLLALWGNLSGIYRQICPGIEVVNPLGACIIPIYGNLLEPYITQCNNLNFYLSPDMTQFGVNEYSPGGPSTGEYGAYNSNGLSCNYIQYLGYTGGSPNVNSSDASSAGVNFPTSPNDYYYSGKNDPASSLLISQDVSSSIFQNIRLTNLLSIANYNGGAINFGVGNTSYATPLFVSAAQNPVAYATPGSGLNNNFSNFGQRALISSYLKELPNPNTPSPLSNTGIISGTRNNSVNKKAFFPPIQSLGTNSRFGSMTLGYNSSAAPIASATFQPYMDFIFFDTSGRIANMPHYRLIPWIYLTNRGSGIAQVGFRITGVGGSQPTSIARFWNAQAFMGPGNPSNISGLDFNHPMYNTNGAYNYIIDPGINNSIPTFIPPYPNYQAVSGYTFAGTGLTASTMGYDGNIVAGSTGNYLNGGTGWGGVYGIVASTGFYQSYIDCGLVDVPIWSGYKGTTTGIPDTTGTSLFWPSTGQLLGLQIGILPNRVQYYLQGYTDLGYGNILDGINFYANGTYQMIWDITTNQIPTTGTIMQLANSVFPSNNNPSINQLLYFINGSNTVLASSISSIVSFNNTGTSPNFTFTGSGVGDYIQLPLLTGQDTNGYLIITGFAYTGGTFTLPNTRGYQKQWTANYITGFGWSGTDKIAKANGSINLNLGISGNGMTSQIFTLSMLQNLSVIPSQFCAPQGFIQHFENININGYTTGNRLLPNYAIPNNNNINTYGAVQGGAFPGLSTQNGMEVFLNFAWSG